MDYSKYYEAREILTDILKIDFLGPGTDDEIICDERPLDYYILGKLYPQTNDGSTEIQSPSEDVGNMDTDAQDSISLCNGKNPSSVGLSFCVLRGIENFTVVNNAAAYALIERSEAQAKLAFKDNAYKDKALFWKRNKVVEEFKTIIQISELQAGRVKKFEVTEGLSLVVLLHKIYEDGSKTITASLVNENSGEYDYKEECVKSFFQPEIIIKCDVIPAFGDTRRNILLDKDPEVQELNMLYSRVNSFASGHGCAVDWKTDECGQAVFLQTDFFPLYEVKQMMPTASFNGDVLSMKYLSQASSNDVVEGLKIIVELYADWITNQEKKAEELEKIHANAAKLNIKKCFNTMERLKKSIEELKDPIIFRAFSLANRAMFDQRKKMLTNTDRFKNDDEIKWFPFQLAFFLQEVYSFAKPDSDEREDVDLLWFPTGGGKTEAYLGISAFVIFLRRLTNKKLGGGVTVIMRYTLRLLTFQQFERASSLICACELIRKQEKIQGGEIGIGLWVGKDLTPNKIDDAIKYFISPEESDPSKGNPTQIKKCPWCGAVLPSDKEHHHCDKSMKRMTVKCDNPECEFHEGLPVYLIDEEIYEHMPTFIIATVDKFAQVALNENTANLFGIDKHSPPELIIQDELHLISGPLGTITGLYETAIMKLCEKNGKKPKIIASTATIRNAKEQIKSLYAANYNQFPPQSIDINDSFFAEVSERTEKPARLYLGCMAIGTSSTTMMIRVMSSLLFGTRYLTELGYDDKIIDSFWTLTGYFNTLRELGGAIVKVIDDIQDRFVYLRDGKFRVKYPLNCEQKRFDRYKELTSREKSEDIGIIIQNDLKIPYKKDGSTVPYDFLLASNMISVGVDVGRLGTMIVVGQPKTTAEYIQATSRVGRESPGLVITTYNQAKSRDRSHYEQFRQYHETFYKFVESTSLTPFSDRSRDRALQALFVMLCRYTIPKLRKNSDAINFKMNMVGVDEVVQYILDYVLMVDEDEVENVKKELIEIQEEWIKRAHRVEKLEYSSYTKETATLFDPDYKVESRFRVLNTMRSVETTVDVISKGV